LVNDETYSNDVGEGPVAVRERGSAFAVSAGGVDELRLVEET
jgi:hypothetical protein